MNERKRSNMNARTRAGLPLNAIFDVSTFETLEESPVSYITQAQYLTETKESSLFAIKSASIRPEFSKEPHDITKELRLLSSLSHPNIIEVLGNTFERATNSIHFWMPFIPSSLADLLDSPVFSPHAHTIPGVHLRSNQAEVSALARSFTYQMVSAVAYLHSPERLIAHRDIKPRNFLIDGSGCVKLIDFGIAWNESISNSEDVLWPEPSSRMCSHVCTGPYRAPETIFGPTTYDPFAVDLWSLGATCAEFFTSLRWIVDDEEDEGDMDDAEDTPVPPFRIPQQFHHGARGRWYRASLFDSSRGSIGLAWSIFKIRGSPIPENWPSFQDLPDANKVNFVDVAPIDLRTQLPNLLDTDDSTPWTGNHFPSEEMVSSPLDLIHRLLVYPPERRLRASQTLYHPWLSPNPLLLPLECARMSEAPCSVTWEGHTLGDMLLRYREYTNT